MILAEGADTVPGWRLLIPLPQEIVWSAIFLLIFVLVFMKFVLPRMNAVLDERSEKIEGGIRNAEKVQEQVDQLKSDQEQELAAARQEAAAIREKARTDGQKIVDEARSRADSENERVLDTLEYDIKVRAFNIAGTSLAPPKYRGNKILMLNTSMWFYKPGLSRPVPISQRQKLMGDASYGDIASTNYAEHYSATRLPDEVVDGEDCYVFDLKARIGKVTYDRIVYWVSKQRQLGLKADYLTVSGKKFKSASMEYGNSVEFNGQRRPFLSRIAMRGELLNGTVTYLQLRSPRIEPIPDYVFDLNLFMR